MTRHPALSNIELPVARQVPDVLAGSDADRSGPAPRRFSVRRVAFAAAAAVLLAGGAWYGWNYWTFGQYLVSTDDAYVKADSTTVAPKVSGYLHEVLVGDNELVKAGQILARIDDRDFKVALHQAEADVAAAQSAIASKQAQLEIQEAVIDATKATIDVDNTAVTFAAQENKRYTDLATSGYGSVQNAQQVQSHIAGARAAIQRDAANPAFTQKQVDLLKAAIAEADATLAHAVAVRRQAELNLGYTSITAPIGGVVGDRTLRTGQFVQAGTQLMSVVPLAGAYVVANFKEMQLTGVRKGQRVEIAIDMFPGYAARGYVDSVAPAGGQKFALLPPDNATGNFTRGARRIQVKIALDHDDPLIELRPGMSVIPTIQTGASDDNRNTTASKLTNSNSGGSCHVRSSNVDLKFRASDLWQRI
jgi:membrane fusion protein, multidrug efflux system